MNWMRMTNLHVWRDGQYLYWCWNMQERVQKQFLINWIIYGFYQLYKGVYYLVWGQQNKYLKMSGVIALGPAPSEPKMEEEKKEIKSHEEIKHPMQFADEIIIEDQTILTISAERMFEEPTKRARRSRWGEKPERKTKNPEAQQLHYNPIEAMMGRKAILPMNQYAMNPMNPQNIGYTRHAPQPPMPPAHPRWGPEYEKTFQPPSLNAIPPGLNIDDLEYIIRLYTLDDVYHKIQNPADPSYDDMDLRSPSPEPIYDANGKRVNTREIRRKENLLRTKSNLIEECMKMRKMFVPPTDFKPMKKSQKIYLTDTAYAPETNYIGQTQKMLEGKTGCKISIRGKGASKTRKIDFDCDDKLHVLVQAETDEQLQKGIDAVSKLLSGEEEDEFKKNQRLQLQVISGVLRDDFCELCHERGHRSWACPSKIAWTKADVKCDICGERSHPTHDCPRKNDPNNKQAYIQSEYNKFLTDLNMKPQQQVSQGGSVQDRVQFITEAKFTGFNHSKQLADDPEIMEQLKQAEKDNQNQQAALNQYTLNNPNFTVQQHYQQQLQSSSQEKQLATFQQASMYGYPYYGYNPYMMNPMAFYGYQNYSSQQQGGFPGQQNQLQGQLGPQQPTPNLFGPPGNQQKK